MDQIDPRMTLALVQGTEWYAEMLERLPAEVHAFTHDIIARCLALSAVIVEVSTNSGPPDPKDVGPIIMGHYLAIKAELTKGGDSGN